MADLSATWSGGVLTLSPNTINDPNSFWYSPSGGPGAIGNKGMDANLYVETTGVFTGQTMHFEGTVTANTLFGHVNQLGNGWTSVAFIKDFASDYSSSSSVTIPLNAGYFNISLALSADPGHQRTRAPRPFTSRLAGRRSTDLGAAADGAGNHRQ